MNGEDGHGSINRLFLERLSTDELIRMADLYGAEIPPDLERSFMIDELLELSSDDELLAEDDDFPSENPPSEAEFPEQAILPRHYNISYIEVMIRDPLWAFVFWELRLSERENIESSEDFENYFLKVIPAGKGENKESEPASGFSIPVEKNDTSWYLGFPPVEGDLQTNGTYRIELCAQKGSAELVLVSSPVFVLPPLAQKKCDISYNGKSDVEAVSLLRLSGIDDLRILRNGDKQPRMKSRDKNMVH